MNEQFSCDCGGDVRPIADDRVEHACGEKYAPMTSFYDGIQRFAPYRRVQVNPELTGGEIRYNWFFDWA